MADEEIEDASEESNELNLHSAGETLRHAREQKNLSLEDLAKTTRIPSTTPAVAWSPVTSTLCQDGPMQLVLANPMLAPSA